MGVLHACMFVYHLYDWCLRRKEEGVGSPGNGVPDGLGTLCGCWEMNLGSLQEQKFLLTAKSFCSLQEYCYSWEEAKTTKEDISDVS